MKLYIPEIGDSIQLSKDWTFNLHCEHRNDILYSLITGKSIEDIYKDMNSFYDTQDRDWASFSKARIVSHTFPKDTILKVDRIYIRKGAEDFSSLTFYVTINKKAYRFWVKLKDVNNIEFNNVVVAKKNKFKFPDGIERPATSFIDTVITKSNTIQKIEDSLSKSSYFSDWKKIGVETKINNYDVNINNEKYIIKLHKEIHSYKVQASKGWFSHFSGGRTYSAVKYKYELVDKNNNTLGSWSTHTSLVKYVNTNIIK